MLAHFLLVLKQTSHISLLLGFYDIRIYLLSLLRQVPLYNVKHNYLKLEPGNVGARGWQTES